MSLYDYNNATIAEIIILGGMGFCAFSILAFCSLIVWCRTYGEGYSWFSGRRRSQSSIVRAQSQSVIRGEHPLTFVLPTVSLSEAGSETEQTHSDLESLGYQSSRPGSPYSSLASLTGSNIYSSSLLSASYSSSTSPSPNSPRSLPLRIPVRGSVPRFSSLPKAVMEDGIAENPSSLGRVGLRITYRKSKAELQVKILRAESIPTNYKTQTANISIKVSLLPSKLPKYITAIVEDSLNPEFNEDFSFLIAKEEITGKVIKLTLMDHDRSQKKVIGFAVLSLESSGMTVGDLELSVREVWLSVKESVEEELTNLLADRLELSLRYDPEPGRLTLGILVSRIYSLAIQDKESDIYVKVTLFEGTRVIKAKKTRLLACNDILEFHEKFSILLPGTYLDSVSCVVSLCSRSRFGGKSVMGRTCVGPFAFASGQGLDHWLEMSRTQGEDIVKWHTMI